MCTRLNSKNCYVSAICPNLSTLFTIPSIPNTQMYMHKKMIKTNKHMVQQLYIILRIEKYLFKSNDDTLPETHNIITRLNVIRYDKFINNERIEWVTAAAFAGIALSAVHSLITWRLELRFRFLHLT